MVTRSVVVALLSGTVDVWLSERSAMVMEWESMLLRRVCEWERGRGGGGEAAGGGGSWQACLKAQLPQGALEKPMKESRRAGGC